MVHGATDDRTRWRRVLPLLRPECTVYALDRRGRGGSGDTPPYSPAREVNDLTTVLRWVSQRHGTPVDLLGHSAGAILALAAATRREPAPLPLPEPVPEPVAVAVEERGRPSVPSPSVPPVRRLVLYEPPLSLPARCQPADLPERLRVLLAAGDRDGAVRAFLREGPRLTEAEIARVRASSRWGRLLNLAHTVLYDARVAGEYAPDPQSLVDFQAPTLLLLGGRSPTWIRSATETLAAGLAHGRIVVLPDEGHAAMDTAKELWASEVLRFLRAPS
jgi:pimeloyl-ACP methyl ester carboxylesterase